MLQLELGDLVGYFVAIDRCLPRKGKVHDGLDMTAYEYGIRRCFNMNERKESEITPFRAVAPEQASRASTMTIDGKGSSP